MVKLKINKRDLEVPDGLTILNVAKSSGISIPTLCYKEGLPHYSSCMVCMVKDNRSNSFVPSCSALVQEGMDIDTNGEEVVSLRKKAVEMLLSEHRAECEAPCKVVCPAGYNIPLMNRLLAAGELEAALELSFSKTKDEAIICINCPGYCENACRRKKVDLPVSIRNLQLFIYSKIKGNENFKLTSNQDISNEVVKEKIISKNILAKRFSSHIGKLEEAELKEWLKECNLNIVRSREIPDDDSATSESQSCMHCDCRAVNNCRLRNISEEMSVKDPRGKMVNSPIVKKINHNTGLIFENAKCIKCGLCVRLCEELKEEPALCFIHRGFVSIISEPLTEEFDNILINRSKEVIEICPTGALSQKTEDRRRK
jgi:predicted molibdopterin-dependent oxidoreductase YjgC